MKRLIVLIALAGLATGCATYSDRGAPGYAEGVDRGVPAYPEEIDVTAPGYPRSIDADARIFPNPAPTPWPQIEVGTESGNMRRELWLP